MSENPSSISHEANVLILALIFKIRYQVKKYNQPFEKNETSEQGEIYALKNIVSYQDLERIDAARSWFFDPTVFQFNTAGFDLKKFWKKFELTVYIF